MKRSKVTIIGAGPAGSVAALTLNKLGHDVTVFERDHFPRYRVGESFLPGTLSILNRLGLQEKIDAAGFIGKPSATFLWGQDQAPWTFSFATPRTAPWVFDHAIQVKREEFDQLLLEEVKERGITVHEGTPVTAVDISDPSKVSVTVRQDGEPRVVESDFVIDAGGAGGPLARQLKVRRYDEFYKNFAIWSYFKRKDPFTGSGLEGTTYSITFEDGWVWMIPLKDDLYSVGLVVDRSKSAEVKELGTERFYRETLAKATRAVEILGDAEIVDEVRIVHDWSYDSELFSDGRFFLCGDSACFTDPLFSQGVHLASQSAVSAAAAIDRITNKEDETESVHAWYNRTYRETYEQYHEFLASFYTFASFTEPESEFWTKRRISESDDDRLSRKKWFDKLVQDGQGSESLSIADFRDRASTMIAIGKHQRQELSGDFSDEELNSARVRWISALTKQLNSIKRFQWHGEEVLLNPHYKVEPLEFRLEPKHVIANEHGVDMVKYPLEEQHREIFEYLNKEPVDYKTLIRQLGEADRKEASSQIVIRLMEAGLLSGYDKNGERVFIQDRLRFDGVGVEYEV
ncbi:chloramphenicol-biosynthetic FADH2-dependent halogenase CmlS [Streptomyces sp. ISL-100]|uniref:chloramphenicol-biosynthetic FADH2-dependent halogenase CmlS n=1 Tax=Streptomyces sp. ISL-100 TaxID=2819173 RepID=UPI001BE509EC|nr:chloramphenicol-biosynthetic FADH2-dependent halogenase CmlS [Streptomyces sp. ISL-100]MBT2401566.1 chloramphenicol-biosynthetic FADH2-dependent halogenase CmlS [Streptomyces sp. ISL-100]